MTDRDRSRKDASIRGGANTHTLGLVALLLAGGACDTATRPKAEGDLPVPLPELEARSERRGPKAHLERIDVYGVERKDAAGARVVLLFDGAPLFHQKRQPAEGVLPARIAIELVDTDWEESVPVSQAVGRGGVERVRLATPNPRVVIDLQRGARGRVFYLTDPYRIVIDVIDDGAARVKKRGPVVVLDPGHGGDEPGAANDEYDLVEAKVVLEIAKLTADRLRAIMPRARVLLTRDDDTGLSLEARCALANAMEADVFVSIHLNAGSEEVRRGGVTTFVLDTTNNRQALRLAARENGTRVAEVTRIQNLLARFHRRDQTNESLRLASKVQRSTLKRGRAVLPRLANRGVRRAMFYVLVGARMPAVLVEASFLTHESEARALTTRNYRRRLADGIATAIASYLQAR